MSGRAMQKQANAAKTVIIVESMLGNRLAMTICVAHPAVMIKAARMPRRSFADIAAPTEITTPRKARQPAITKRYVTGSCSHKKAIPVATNGSVAYTVMTFATVVRCKDAT
ncbi:hypothetical protein GCM10008012_19040 [Rhizobium anhuiense]|nr:hypothetical protein GCM10008012_19040 [Rhizobium anhuiense]